MSFDKQILENLLAETGITDYRYVHPETDVFVRQWVRFRCMFGCKGYGACGSCAPAVPSLAECCEMIMDYSDALLIHETVPFTDSRSYNERLFAIYKQHMEMERKAFLAGCYKAFLLPLIPCRLCKVCQATEDHARCVNKKNSRPGIEAMGVDVFATARKAGYDIRVVTEFGQNTDRFSLLLLD